MGILEQFKNKDMRKLKIWLFKKWLRQELVYYSGYIAGLGEQFFDPSCDDFEFVDQYMNNKLMD